MTSRASRWIRGVVALAAPAGAASAAVILASVALPVPAAATPVTCRAYPRPGSTSAGQAPAIVRAQYGALRRHPGTADRIPVRFLRSLPESGILPSAVRRLGSLPGRARAYLVPSEHLLAEPLEPARCLPPAQRPRQLTVLHTLRREYGNDGLCLVIVGGGEATPACGPAPGTVAPLLHGPGTPALGITPDGVASVSVGFRHQRAPLTATVHDNFWSIASAQPSLNACGLQWLERDGTVLRTVRSCTPDTE